MKKRYKLIQLWMIPALLIALSGCGGSDSPAGAGAASEASTKTTLAPGVSAVNWVKCAEEWQVCSFTGTTQVRYGLNNTWVSLTATDFIACNNDVFGDPLPGADKICEYQATSTEPPPPTSNGELPQPVPSSTQMTMSCPDGTAFQCSGTSPIRVENGVTLTNSGVFSYGRSTSDTSGTVGSDLVSGLAPASGGHVEFRISKSSAGQVSKPILLLDQIGISWDGKKQRPKIIEGFRTTAGRATLNTNGSYAFGSLPLSSNLTFYDYANKGTGATQGNYANNNYFPRSGNPVRCPDDWPSCPTVETSGIKYSSGNWRSGGITPNVANAARLHGDGDIHAGNGPNNTILPGGNGIGVPFPGSKGYREFINWNYQYANLAAWLTHDTVQIFEWTGTSGAYEHNQNRRGMIAYGSVTSPTAVPSAGIVTYAGMVYGWYSANKTDEPVFFKGRVSITADFGTRQVLIEIRDTISDDSTSMKVPANLKVSAGMGASGSNVSNYFTAPTGSQGLTGGISGRFFGSVLASGSGGKGPAETAGSFTLHDGTTGATAIAGFIALKK